MSGLTDPDRGDIIQSAPLPGVPYPVVPVKFNMEGSLRSWEGGVYDFKNGCVANSSLIPDTLTSEPRIPIVSLSETSPCSKLTAIINAGTTGPNSHLVSGIIVYSADGTYVDPSVLEYAMVPVVELSLGDVMTVLDGLRLIQGYPAPEVSSLRGGRVPRGWVGYFTVDQVMPQQPLPLPTTFKSQDVDPSLLWQFGLALIGGVVFFAIPCTCLMSWWAKRRLEQNFPVQVTDLEEGQVQTEATNPQVMKETDLDLFPLKIYHPHRHHSRPRRDSRDHDHCAAAAEPISCGDGTQIAQSPHHPNALCEISQMESVATLVQFPETDITDLTDDTHVRRTPINQPRPSSDNDDAVSVNSCTTSIAYSIDTCPICLDVFQDGEAIRELVPCKHYYHQECIQHWLTQRKGVCPMCRNDLVRVEDGEGNGQGEALEAVEAVDGEGVHQIAGETGVEAEGRDAHAVADSGSGGVAGRLDSHGAARESASEAHS
ncbi:hypothetical protein HK104_007567 [Borealophlyctis nickersoniae]|nr:hypothetical protein HK104_007567 [Borealophlyctis nickersoniae]